MFDRAVGEVGECLNLLTQFAALCDREQQLKPPNSALIVMCYVHLTMLNLYLFLKTTL